MTSLRCLVVDDEPLARSRLSRMLGEVGVCRCEVVAQAANAVDAMSALLHHVPDVVFLDIQMPGVSGIELAKRLREQGSQTAVVFVTAHHDHAVDAFAVRATDYLTKPVNTQRLLDCVERLLAAKVVLADAQKPASRVADDTDAVIVQGHQRVFRLALADVLVLKADLKYVTAITASGEHVLSQSLTEMEDGWPHLFLRVHRGALVARRALAGLRRSTAADASGANGAEGWEVQIDGFEESILVSRRQLAAVKDALSGLGR